MPLASLPIKSGPAGFDARDVNAGHACFPAQTTA
jgi:hypothetical protein